MKNAKELTLDELKKISLDGLVWLKKICESYKLQYFLAYGTLLGAVRHKGFIPWDDDIDVWMPRKDYDKLMQIAAQVEDESWVILSNETQKKYLFPWAKVANKETVVKPSRFNNGFLYGVSIDIFPLDNCPGENFEEAKANMKQLKAEYANRFRKLRPYSGGLEGTPNAFVKIAKMTYYYVTRAILGRVEDDLTRWSDLQRGRSDTGYVSCALSPVPGVWPRDGFEQSVQLEFEKILFNAPKGYDEILTLFYGDYMTPPPVEKQITHHSFKAYRILESNEK